MTPEELALALLDVLVEKVGLPLLAKAFAARVPQNQANALLDAEYSAARAAADAAALKIVDG